MGTVGSRRKARLGIEVLEMPKYWWCFGVSLQRMDNEIYLLLYVFKWSIAIGKIVKV